MKSPRLRDIIRATCEIVGVTKLEMVKHGRHHTQGMKARKIAAYLAVQHQHPLLVIAVQLERDHCTVIHSSRWVEDELVLHQGTELAALVKECEARAFDLTAAFIREMRLAARTLVTPCPIRAAVENEARKVGSEAYRTGKW